MKYLLFFLLIVTVIITAGCVSENKNTVVTPTQTPLTPTITSTPTPNTPIIIPTPTETKVYHGASTNPYEPCGDAMLNVIKCRNEIITDKEYCDYWERRSISACENLPPIEEVITPTPTPIPTLRYIRVATTQEPTMAECGVSDHYCPVNHNCCLPEGICYEACPYGTWDATICKCVVWIS